MTRKSIVVDALVDAPKEMAWEAYTSPSHVMRWNFASDDWHCPTARADLRVGGTFSARMEAKDGSVGFDFEGTYSRIIKNELLEYTFGDRRAMVEFLPMGGKILVRVTFDRRGSIRSISNASAGSRSSTTTPDTPVIFSDRQLLQCAPLCKGSSVMFRADSHPPRS